MTKPKNADVRADRLITRLTTWLAGGLLVLFVGWAAYAGWGLLRHEETNDAQVEEYITPVNSKLTAFVQQVRYHDNQPVHAGDTLVLLDDRDYQVAAAEAEAALATSQAQLRVQGYSFQTTRRTSTVSEAQLEAAQARLREQQQEYDRYRQLRTEEAVTAQQFERVETARDVARAEYQALQNTHAASLAHVDETSGQQAVLRAEVKRRQALLRKARLDLAYTVIKAPYDGRLGRQAVQEGQLVQAGQPLATIVNAHAGKWVTANFKETQLRYLQLGQAVRIMADAYPGHIFAGRIESLAPATGARFSLLPPDNATGNFVKVIQRVPVRIQLTDAAPVAARLQAGMNVTVEVDK